MAFLIGQLTWWLLLAGLLAGAAGWAWHVIRSAPKLKELEDERDRLRGELLGFFAGEPVAGRGEEADREMEMLRTRETVAGARATEMERALAEARDRNQELLGRVAELERSLEHAQIPALPPPDDEKSALAARVAELETAAQAHASRDELNAALWRLRYFEARTRYLENEERQAQPVAETPEPLLLAPPPESAPAARDGDELAALKWRARYLESRVHYLESQAGRDADAEAERRKVWRARYMEARAAHLETEAAQSAGAHAEAIAAKTARIAELEAAAAAAAALDSPAARMKWRAHYLDARVRHLEGQLSAAHEAVAPVATEAVEETPADPPPLVPHGAEVRPPALAAPRNGAPDDLTLIDGVSPKTEATLHALGIHHFDQIAEWAPAHVAWVDQYLRYRGRIVRERWVEQARELAQGSFASRKYYFETESA